MGFIRYRSGHRSVSEDMAEKTIAGFTWLVLSFSRKHPFPNDVLYPESERSFLSTTAPPEENTRSKWIYGRFAKLKQWCNMETWKITFSPEPEKLDANTADPKQHNRLTQVHADPCDEKYYVDDFGRPIFYYDGSKTTEHGYINYRIVRKLAEQLHKTAKKPLNIRIIPNKELYIMCDVFLGFGHISCAQNQGAEHKHQYAPHGNTAAFSLAIYFTLQGIGKSKALKTYGRLLSKQTKRDLKLAFMQLDEYKDQMQQLIVIYENIDKQRLVA